MAQPIIDENIPSANQEGAAHSVATLYQAVPSKIFDACKQIKLVVFDVDGVFSDGSIYLGNNGEEYKAFNTKDGYGVKALKSCGIDVAVITGRDSAIVKNRMSALGVKHLVQGREDKHTALTDLLNQLKLETSQVASMGDDMPDVGMYRLSAIKVAVNDAHPYVKQQANFITTLGGGKGAVREFCDLLLQAHGKLNMQHGASV
ncbi:3-deoxy-manno-octulosonate-8-phosphatase KdsC [Glaciecola sp. 2405UD65-10]|uniref:3-deoxy-manno-octulosonate-8-phosphatase KdsC n=1 Tax=Glaciecola sp. 2405UD65-10 TaxID=3397244 RepID=UPI003B5B670E